MIDYTFILNPLAGRGVAEKLAGPLQDLLRAREVRHEFLRTTGRGEATWLAEHARGRIVVAVGGDGTVNEVAAGVLRSKRTLGVIPAGSGNDFIKSIGIPAKYGPALEKLIAGKSRLIDVGTVSCRRYDDAGGPAGNSPTRNFVNGVGIGFDAAVAKRTAEIRYLKGVPLYLAAVFESLGSYRSPEFEVTVDAERTTARHMLIAVGNGPCAGGGFYLTPDASVDDGLFDVCLVDDLSIPAVLMLMPKVMKGKHQHEDGVKFLRGKSILVSSRDKFYVHADGEIVGDNVNEVRIELTGRALSVIGG